MPTGYTAGIIDGTTETFQEFAKQCMRNFGATIHMRDDNMDKDYEPRVPSPYNYEQIKAAKEKLKQAEELSDSELIGMKKNELEKDSQDHLKRIDKIKIARKRLGEFLIQAKKFDPPTKEHEGIAKFMVEQIEKTIDFDGDTKYHDEALLRIDNELLNLDAEIIRLSLKEAAHKDINYHLKQHREELTRCKENNFWVVQFLEALK